MKRTRNILMTVFVAVIMIALLVVAVCESDMVDVGILSAYGSEEFILTSVMELVTLAVIPLTLRLFKLSKVTDDLVERKELALLKWGLVRILMLGVPMVLNTVLYYLFMSTTFGYVAIIVLLCMPFTFPSLDRCYYDVSTGKKEK